MKAVVQDGFGSPREVLRLAEVDPPTAGGDEVLVRVHAASIHVGDYYAIAGLPYVMRPMFAAMRPRSRVPGTDIAGIVEAVGADVSRFRPGDEVIGSHRAAFAELAAFPERSLASKPGNLTFEEASTLGVSAMTALQALRDHGRVRAGQEVLVTGASGGVGTFAVQIAKSMGAHVTGVCSTGNLDLVRSIGADRVIDYTTDDFTAGARRYDLVFDNVGRLPLSQTRRILKPDGTLLANGAPVGGWFGGLGRPIAAFATSLVVRRQGRPFVSTATTADLVALAELAGAGAVAPVVDTILPLDQAPAAVTEVGEGHNRGKTVLTLATGRS